MTDAYDFIIVGAGSASFVLANRLTARAAPTRAADHGAVAARNAASPTMMIAERGAEMILADAKAR